MSTRQSPHDTKQPPDSWTWRDGGEAIRMPDWVRDDQDTRDRACGRMSPDLLFGCTRPPGHPGRHIATGVLDMFAAWPGVHVPVRADLGVGDGASEIEPEQARALAARMIEAADIVDQIRDGAR